MTSSPPPSRRIWPMQATMLLLRQRASVCLCVSFTRLSVYISRGGYSGCRLARKLFLFIRQHDRFDIYCICMYAPCPPCRSPYISIYKYILSNKSAFNKIQQKPNAIVCTHFDYIISFVVDVATAVTAHAAAAAVAHVAPLLSSSSTVAVLLSMWLPPQCLAQQFLTVCAQHYQRENAHSTVHTRALNRALRPTSEQRPGI